MKLNSFISAESGLAKTVKKLVNFDEKEKVSQSSIITD